MNFTNEVKNLNSLDTKGELEIQFNVEPIDKVLTVVALNWDRDAIGLYDYDYALFEISKIKILGCTFLARDEKNQLKLIMPEIESPRDFTSLLSVVFKNKSYWVFNRQSLYNAEGYIDESFEHTD